MKALKLSLLFSRITPPAFVRTFSDQEKTEGELVQLVVQVSGTPPISVVWYRDDEKIVSGDHCKISCDGDIHVLKIEQAEIEDEAMYRCVASNTAGSAQCEAEVLVEGEPLWR